MFVACSETLAVDMMNVDGAGAAKQRRERRLRAMLKHERQTVAMELAAALHHSRDARSNVTYKSLTGTEDGKLEAGNPFGAPASSEARGAAAPGLWPVLASVFGEDVDASSLAVLLHFSLAAQMQKEKEDEVPQRPRARSLTTALVWPPSGRGARKRKKKKKRLLRSSPLPRWVSGCRLKRTRRLDSCGTAARHCSFTQWPHEAFGRISLIST